MKKPTVRHEPLQPTAPSPETRPSGNPRHPTDMQTAAAERKATQQKCIGRRQDRSQQPGKKTKQHTRSHTSEKTQPARIKKRPHAVLPVSVFRQHLHRRRSCARSPWRPAQPGFEMEETRFSRTASAPANGSLPNRPHRRTSTIGSAPTIGEQKNLSAERISGITRKIENFRKTGRLCPPKKNCTHTALAFHRSEKKHVPTEIGDTSDGVRPDNASAITQKKARHLLKFNSLRAFE